VKAVVHHRYGAPRDVLALEEIPQPEIGDGDVLARVHAAGISYPDGAMTTGVPYVLRLVAGLRRPRHGVRGTEVAGTVTAAGAKVGDLARAMRSSAAAAARPMAVGSPNMLAAGARWSPACPLRSPLSGLLRSRCQG